MIINIYDYLDYGPGNARTAKELATLLNSSEREITREINRERLAGAPIGSGSTSDAGYWRLDGEADRLEVCARLRHRIEEQQRTLDALLECAIDPPDARI